MNEDYKMNKCMDREYTARSTQRVDAREESLFERVVTMLCFVIAFFENRFVRTLCRGVAVVMLGVGCFAFANAVMGGAALGEIVIGGAVLVLSAAMLFGTGVKEGSRE